MGILQNIFSDHFHKLLNSNIKIRDTVIENVDKMIHCGDFKRGYAFYICEHCSRFMVSPFRCRSRFCPSCGNLYSRKRSTAMSFKLVRTSHRHCVFTIPEELRIFFRKDRSLLNLLFNIAWNYRHIKDTLVKVLSYIQKIALLSIFYQVFTYKINLTLCKIAYFCIFSWYHPENHSRLLQHLSAKNRLCYIQGQHSVSCGQP